jgi:hypothetical protein
MEFNRSTNKETFIPTSSMGDIARGPRLVRR